MIGAKVFFCVFVFVCLNAFVDAKDFLPLFLKEHQELSRTDPVDKYYFNINEGTIQKINIECPLNRFGEETILSYFTYLRDGEISKFSSKVIIASADGSGKTLSLYPGFGAGFDSNKNVLRIAFNSDILDLERGTVILCEGSETHLYNFNTVSKAADTTSTPLKPKIDNDNGDRVKVSWDQTVDPILALNCTFNTRHSGWWYSTEPVNREVALIGSIDSDLKIMQKTNGYRLSKMKSVNQGWMFLLLISVEKHTAGTEYVCYGDRKVIYEIDHVEPLTTPMSDGDATDLPVVTTTATPRRGNRAHLSTAYSSKYGPQFAMECFVENDQELKWYKVNAGSSGESLEVVKVKKSLKVTTSQPDYVTEIKPSIHGNIVILKVPRKSLPRAGVQFTCYTHDSNYKSFILTPKYGFEVHEELFAHITGHHAYGNMLGATLTKVILIGLKITGLFLAVLFITGIFYSMTLLVIKACRKNTPSGKNRGPKIKKVCVTGREAQFQYYNDAFLHDGEQVKI